MAGWHVLYERNSTLGGRRGSIKLGELLNIKMRILFTLIGLALITVMILAYIALRVFVLPDKISFLDFALLCTFATTCLLLTVAQLHFLRQLVHRSGKRIEDMTYTDELTGLGNRRHIARFLDEEFSEVEFAKRPLSVLFIDLNKFKQINDELGHAAGDAVLRQFAAILRSSTRDTDFIGRAGGDEFMVILPGTSAEFATVVAKRIAGKAAQARVVTEAGVIDSLSASIGISEFPKNAKTRSYLMEDADRTMYAAKYAGSGILASTTSPDSRVEGTERGQMTALTEQMKDVVGRAPAVEVCRNV